MIDARLKARLLWTIFHHESMYKTRNLFRANGSKGFRVSVWMGCTAVRGAFYLLVYPSMPCSAGS